MKSEFKSRLGRRIAVAVLLVLVSLSSGAQQKKNDEASITRFLNSVAGLIYKAAWPSATYRSWELDGFSQVPGGFDAVVTLDGRSGIDGSDLWVRLAIPFRNGDLGTPRVLSHNAFWVDPFVTTLLTLRTLAQLSQQADANGGSLPRNQQASSVPNNTEQPVSAYAGSEASIERVLARWRESIVANDAQAESALYAPVVQSYYGRTRISNAELSLDKAAFIDGGHRVTELTLEDVSFQYLDADTAHMLLTKNVVWTNPNGSETHKHLHSHIDLQRYGSNWMITGERDDR